MVIVKIKCYICLEGFEGNVVITKCRHLGHLACVKKWVDHAHKCFECGRGLCSHEYSLVGKGYAKYCMPVVTTLPSKVPCLVGLDPDREEDLDYAVSVVSDLVGRPIAYVTVLGRQGRSIPGSVEVSEEGLVVRVGSTFDPFGGSAKRRISVSFGVLVT